MIKTRVNNYIEVYLDGCVNQMFQVPAFATIACYQILEPFLINHLQLVSTSLFNFLVIAIHSPDDENYGSWSFERESTVHSIIVTNFNEQSDQHL